MLSNSAFDHGYSASLKRDLETGVIKSFSGRALVAGFSPSELPMFSQDVWAIAELVRLICSYTLEYKNAHIYEDRRNHDGLVLSWSSRRTLARCVIFLNRFISRIAVEAIWKELNSLEPLCATLPLDYVENVVPSGSGYVSGLYYYPR